MPGNTMNKLRSRWMSVKPHTRGRDSPQDRTALPSTEHGMAPHITAPSRPVTTTTTYTNIHAAYMYICADYAAVTLSRGIGAPTQEHSETRTGRPFTVDVSHHPSSSPDRDTASSSPRAVCMHTRPRWAARPGQSVDLRGWESGMSDRSSRRVVFVFGFVKLARGVVLVL